MRDLLVEDILNVTKGTLIIGDTKVKCENFSKDTRTIQKDDVYIGIKGERFDGNIFWKEAFDAGAKVVIIQGIDFFEELTKYEDKVIIKVNSTLDALYEIARFKRSLYNIPIIGITGSVGKTSTKDIIASVVSKKYKTLKTEGNNNNNIGLPFTILKLKDHEAAVIEMGMNHKGEISLLTNIAKPTISVITNVGTSHIGNLGSRENILKAKLEILEGMEKPQVIINNDNDMLNKWYINNIDKSYIHTFAIENKSDIMAKNIELYEEYSTFMCDIDGKSVNVKVPIGGNHFVLNALCAICVGNALNMEIDLIRNGIEEFKLTKKRMDVKNLRNGAKIINDSYNASFESMKEALKYLSGFNKSRKIAVLGDMFELGDFSQDLHEKVGQEVVKNNIDILICSGKESEYIAKKAKSLGMIQENVYFLEKKEDIITLLNKIITNNDVILFKASNGMRFFELIDKLMNIIN